MRTLTAAIVAMLLSASFGFGRWADAQEKIGEKPAAADKPAAEKGAAERPPVRGTPGIFTMDPDGSNIRLLAKIPGVNSHGSPSWSHNGDMVAFDAGSPAHFYVYAVKGPFKGVLRDMGPGLYPTFSPIDGTIAYGGPPNPNGQTREPGVWLINSYGTAGRFLCDGDHPKWSPDGKSIAIAHDEHGPGTIDIVNVETGKAVRVLTSTYDRIHGATFSPDGTKLAFIGYDDAKRTSGDLVVMAADGAPESRHTIRKGKIGWVPNWSPDGKQITYVLWTKIQNVNIDTSYVIDADGKNEPVKLNNQEGTRNVEAEWSPDGKTLVFASDRQIDEKVKIDAAPAPGAR